MIQYTPREFISIVRANGFYYTKTNGDHSIYKNDKGEHISVPILRIEAPIARRLIKEYNLETDIKKAKRKNK